MMTTKKAATPSSGVVLPWGVGASLITVKIQSCISRYSQNQTQISLQTHPKLKLATKNKNSIGVEPNNKPSGRNRGSTGLWERRTEGKGGGETVVSERWVAPTNIELEKGSAGEGGVVELWERRTDGGLHFELKVEPLNYDLRVGERQSMVCVLEEGEGRAC
nr:hypothetical protein CFP56_44889 [Quercus suber]